MKNLIYKLIAVSILAGSLIIGYFWYQFNVYLDTALPINDNITYEIKPGDNLTRVVKDLHKKEIVKHPRYLLWYARLYANANEIHVGEYELSGKLTPKQLLEVFLSGKVKHYSFTIIEGWTFRQMIEEMAKHPDLTRTIDTNASNKEIMQKIGQEGMHHEGRFLPDTYYFTRGMRDVDILKRAHKAMKTFLEKEWETRDFDIPIKTPYEALILASIVEKETGQVYERGTIAGVFSRRLVKRMRLQTDPTVIYGMGDKFKGNIRRKDLKKDTPYNTYTRFGLPPTPIALPSRDAIKAALHPEEGNTLYFVSKGDGSHYFSETLEEHNEAVIKYQLKGKRKDFSSFKNK